MVRKRNHDYEIEMSGLKSLKEGKPLEDTEKCQAQLAAEADKNKKLMEENEQLKKEKAELEKKALEDANKAYKEIIKSIGKCIR